MAEEEDQTINRGWSTCPLDVLLHIFEELDGESLLNCLRVNSWWKDSVDYYAQHSIRWKKIAEAGMVNKGRKFRDKSSPFMSWRDLFCNYKLWNHVESASITRGYYRASEEILTLQLFKDILLTGHGEKDDITGDDILYKEFNMEQHKIQDILPSNLHAQKGGCESYKSKEENFNDKILKIDEEQCDRMKEKLLKECPFTKYTIFDDNCFYIFDERNVMRRFVWDEVEEKWTDEVLGRYYGCTRSIKDIHTSDGAVYILSKTGNVMGADRESINFVNTTYLDLPPQSLLLHIRLLQSPVRRTLETAHKLKLSAFITSTCACTNIQLIHKFNAVVGVPLGNKFNIRRQEGMDQVILECPDLSHALEHGEMLLLGYNDGRVDICKVRDLFEIGYKPKLSFNILDCPNCLDVIDDPAIVGIEVFESKESHHVLVASHFNIYTISLTYPERITKRYP